MHADIKLDVIAHQRNVWEPRKRAFIGTLQDLAWSELLPHLDATKLSGARLKKTPHVCHRPISTAGPLHPRKMGPGAGP